MQNPETDGGQTNRSRGPEVRVTAPLRESYFASAGVTSACRYDGNTSYGFARSRVTCTSRTERSARTVSDPSHFGDAHRALQARAGESPDRIDLPFWLDACVLLDPPMRNGKPRAARHAIYPVARALLADRIRVRGYAGDAAVPLDRAALARCAGYVDYKKAAWIFDYLQRIGFLEIHKHWTKGGRRPDTFDVFITPPANYVGPTTYAELNAALRAHGRGEPVRLWIQQNRSSEPRFPGEHHGPDPRFPGEHHGSENRSSEPRFPGEHHASDREISDLDREIGDRSERDAARGAGAVVVAPAEDELTTAVQELVQRLPWE